MAKSERIHGVNFERLKYAREFYGFSHHEVCDRTKLKIDELLGIEEGKILPSYAKLSKLAEFYKRPLLYFFFPSLPSVESDLKVAFRSAQKQINQPLDLPMRLMIEKANEYKLNLEELYKNDERVCFTQLISECEVVATKKYNEWLREKLDLSLEIQKGNFNSASKLLEYIREKLYDIGVYVFKDSFKTNDVSGLCLYDAMYPIILLNNKTTFTRQLFTVFHELYHIWKKETSIDMINNNEEQECDKFASEFLIPTDDFNSMICNVQYLEELEEISRIAAGYKVSPEAIAYRLLNMQKISNELYITVRQRSYDIREKNSESTGGNFYYTRMSYLGKPYLKLVFNNYYTGKIDVTSVGKYTGLKTAHVPKLASNMFGGDF